MADINYVATGYTSSGYSQTGVTIDWGTKVIFIPTFFMVKIQSVPSAVYQLDLNDLWLALKDLEDSENGMMFPDTHIRNASVSVSGAVLAPVIEIINGYSVTFEELTVPYRVNAVGANSNIGEKQNVNTVSLSTSNSAGLQDLNSLQAASFGGEVTIDVNSSFTGTTFPTGTRSNPVNNLADAHAIADKRGIFDFRISSSMTFGSEDLSDGHRFLGDSVNVVVNLSAGANVSNCTFNNLTVTGVLDSGNALKQCVTYNLSGLNGIILSCILSGTLDIAPLGTITIAQSASAIGETSIIDMVGTGQNLAIRDFTGGLQIDNKTDATSVIIDMSSGVVTVDSTVTAGDIVIRGIAEVIDNSTGSTVVTDSTETALNRNTIYAGEVSIDVNSGTSGTLYPIGTKGTPVNNIADAILIANRLNVKTLRIAEDATILATDDVSGFIIKGSHAIKSEVTVLAGATTTFTEFMFCSLTGTLDGDVTIAECTINDITDFSGKIQKTTISGMVTLTGNKDAVILDCFSGVNGQNTPSIDMGGSGRGLSFRNYSGGIKIENKTGTEDVSIDMNSGQVIIDGSVTNGTILVRGSAKLTDNSTGSAVVTDETDTTGINNAEAASMNSNVILLSDYRPS